MRSRSSTVGATSVELTIPSVRVEPEYSVVPPRIPAAPIAMSRLVMWLGSWTTSTRSCERRASSNSRSCPRPGGPGGSFTTIRSVVCHRARPGR